MPSAAQDEFDAMYDTQEKKLTCHPEDTQDSSSDNDSTTLRSSHEENRIPVPRPSTTMPSATYHIPSTTTFYANTGPKGVIADAQSFDTAKKRSFRQTLRAYSNGELSPPIFGKSKKPAFNFSREKSPSPDASADDDEDDFMRTWRANRLTELANNSTDVRTRRSSPSMRKYGTLLTVDPSGYLDAIEKVHAETTVIVFIYDNLSEVSRIVEDALRHLAHKHATSRFVKLHYHDAEMNDIAVPGIIAYKGGECFANLVSLVNEIPSGRDMNSSTLEWMLQQHKILL
ncbi:MAG: hypothetical protein L6R38_001129 [Xanthoria sp. 2 TBL-2021]|nr:MAG: hypothetical protein L6R38_001129 [Xanthoria sp. 2 TBL-2021]